MMTNVQNNVLKKRFVDFSKYASLIIIFIGVLSLIGWVFDIQIFRSTSLSLESTKVNTATVFILSGIVLLLTHKENLKKTYVYIRQVLSVVIFLIGLLTLFQYVFNLDFGIDQLLLKDLHTAPDSFPGRMSFASAVCTIFVGLALIYINNPNGSKRWIGQYPAIIVITIAFLALLGYSYDVQALYRIDAYSTMGLNTAIAFTLCALAILWAKPDEGWTKIIIAESAGGYVLRRLLLPILIVPLLLGWAIVLGERAGLYDTHFGLAVISVLITGFLIITLLVNGHQLNRVDQNRKQVEERYQNVLDNLMEGAQIIGFDWRYLYVNEEVAKQGHQTKENLLGRTMMEVYPGFEHTAVFTTLKKAMQERTSHIMENEFIYPDGQKGWFELNIQPIKEGLFVLSNDITKRKIAEQQLYQLNMELEQRIVQRTTQLNNELMLREQAEKVVLHQNKMLSDLHQITLDLLKQDSLEKLLNRVVEISAILLDATYAAITLIEGNTLAVKAVTQNQTRLLGQKLSRDDAKLTWQAFDTRQTMVLKDYDTWEHRRKDYQGLVNHAVIDFPILNSNECLGVLALGRDKPNYEFSEEQIQFGSLFASLTALIITNSQLRDILKQQSICDSLTGLYNHRYMEESLKQEISRATRQNYPLGVIMFDIDFFKNYNDSFGHMAGDALLQELGKFLQTNIRAEDIACRYGGEEFLLILPNSQLEVIQQRAELLRKGVTQLQVFDNKKTFTDITISAGIAMYPQHGTNMEDLIRSADNALYQAKQKGRNRVELARAS